MIFEAIAALVLALTGEACPAFDVHLDQRYGATYDPTQLQGQRVQVAARVSNPDPECRDANMAIRPRNGAGVIRLRSGAQDLALSPVASTGLAYSGRDQLVLDSSARQALQRDGVVALDLFQIEPGQYLPAGEYLAELEWQVEGQVPQPFDINVRVEPAIRFVGDEVRSLSLGEVSGGGQVSTTFLYKTNAAVRVTAQSSNGGQMVHELGAHLGAIPYRATLSGQYLDLASGAAINLPLRRLGLNAAELSVSVQPVTGHYAGIYRDVLTIDFRAY